MPGYNQCYIMRFRYWLLFEKEVRILTSTVNWQTGAENYIKVGRCSELAVKYLLLNVGCEKVLSILFHLKKEIPLSNLNICLCF